MLSPEPLLWADDETEREQSDAQRRRYYPLIIFCCVFQQSRNSDFRTELFLKPAVAFHAAISH